MLSATPMLKPVGAFIWIWLAIFSICMGSLINMLIYRLPLIAEAEEQAQDNTNKKSISLFHPRSHCPHCKTNLCWYDLIPLLGWCWQAGRCRHCKTAIAPRYLYIELLSCAYSMLCLLHWGIQPMSFAMLGFGYMAILMIALDIQYLWIPDSLNYLLLWSGLLLSCSNISSVTPSQAILGAVSGYLILWFVNQLYLLLRKQHGIGGGDMKLLAALGAWCGLVNSCLILWIAVVLTLIIALIFMCLRRLQWQQRIAFGPALLCSAAIVLFTPHLMHTLLLAL